MSQYDPNQQSYGQYQPPASQKKSHKVRNSLLATGGALAVVVVVAVAVSAGHESTDGTGVTAAPASPAAAASPAAPAPTAPPAVQHVTKTITGHGSETTGPLHFGCVIDGNPIKVVYSYSGNSEGYGGDNFTAELDDVSGMPVGDGIVNDIAESGSHETNLYPDEDFSTPPFHLAVEGDQEAHWSFKFTCDKGN